MVDKPTTTVEQMIEWLDGEIKGLSIAHEFAERVEILRAIRDQLTASLPPKGMKSAEIWLREIFYGMTDATLDVNINMDFTCNNPDKNKDWIKTIERIQADAVASRAPEPDDHNRLHATFNPVPGIKPLAPSHPPLKEGELLDEIMSAVENIEQYVPVREPDDFKKFGEIRVSDALRAIRNVKRIIRYAQNTRAIPAQKDAEATRPIFDASNIAAEIVKVHGSTDLVQVHRVLAAIRSLKSKVRE